MYVATFPIPTAILEPIKLPCTTHGKTKIPKVKFRKYYGVRDRKPAKTAYCSVLQFEPPKFLPQPDSK